MVRVRMLSGLVGIEVAVEPGGIFSCDTATAARLVAAEVAEYVDPRDAEPEPELAMVAPPERAIRKRGRPRKESA